MTHLNLRRSSSCPRVNWASTKHLLCSVCMPIMTLIMIGNTHSQGPFHADNDQEI